MLYILKSFVEKVNLLFQFAFVSILKEHGLFVRGYFSPQIEIFSLQINGKTTLKYEFLVFLIQKFNTFRQLLNFPLVIFVLTFDNILILAHFFQLLFQRSCLFFRLIEAPFEFSRF